MIPSKRSNQLSVKRRIEDLALLGGAPLFSSPKSTSNLLRPDVERYLNYSRLFFEQKQYTNNGPNVKALQQRLADFHQTQYCLVFSSGFWALALAIRYLKLAGRTEIIIPSLTYRRMTDICAWAGLAPRFCEVDPNTLAMTEETVRSCITPQTALILGVHPIVNCAEAQRLQDMAQDYGIPLLFDSVESVYESLPEGRIGGFGRAECFSLHACKLLNGFGGGYLTTNDEILAKTLSAQRGFGFTAIDHIGVPGGLNAKLNEMHAAMALASLDDIEQQVVLNRQRYQCYQQALTAVPGISLLAFDETQRCGYKNIVVRMEDIWPLSRAVTLRILNAEQVLARAYYDPPLHHKTMHYPHVTANLPQTDRFSQSFVNLPCGQQVSTDDINSIASLMIFLFENSNEINCALQETLL